MSRDSGDDCRGGTPPGGSRIDDFRWIWSDFEMVRGLGDCDLKVKYQKLKEGKGFEIPK